MPTDIGPRIGIDGEKEFRQELTNISQQVRTLGSEMKAVTSAFDEGDQSQAKLTQQSQVLTKQIEAQRQKLELLQKGLDASAQKYGENDTKTLKWAQAVNSATADLNKMRQQLDKTESAMDDLGDSMDDIGSSAGGLSGLTGSGGLGGLLSSGGLGGLLSKGFAVGAVVSGIKEVTGAMFDLVDSTQEYRSIMASLEVSSQTAGYTAEQTAQTYERLQSVLGDQQTAATATANLQSIGLSQEQLMTVTDAAIGAWAKYGDSIPIDGLAEAINETIQAGTVTGSFADVLNWAGTNEDDFNAKLQSANSTSERANIVMQELANQGLTQAGQAWIENNQDIVENNKSTDKLNQAWARLGSAVSPLVANLRSLAADGINFLIDTGENAVSFFSSLPEKALTWGKDLIDNFVDGIKDKVSSLVSAVKDVAGSVADFIGFSEPDKGPLSDFHTYAPDMMKLYSQGIRDNLWRVTDAMDSAAERMQRSVPGPQIEIPAGTVSAGGGLSAQPGLYRIEIPVYINGKELYRATLGDLLSAINTSSRATGRGQLAY